jgi:xylulokinase
MAEKYIISHDLGTSSDKAILITVFGKIIDSAKQDYPLFHPQPGFAEQDPLELWKAVCSTTREVIAKTSVSVNDIVGMTFSSQMQGLIPVTQEGTPLYPAMTWLDGRAADIIREELWNLPRVMGYNIFKLLKFIKITGGSPGQAGKDQIGKLLWLRKYKPEVFKNSYKFTDIKDFIIFKLTGEFTTSADIGVIWWLLDTRKNLNQWHPGLCKLAGITPDRLSQVKESAAIVGTLTDEAATETGLNKNTSIINGAGDLSCAALGSGAINEGELHISIGTSGWVAGHYTKRKIDIAHYTGCIGSAYPQKYYLGMAHQETAGLCLEWLKNKVLYHEEQLMEEKQKSKIYELLDDLAAKASPGADGLLFTPWMFGERCPLDDDYVRGSLMNLSLNHSREHLIRAVLEGIAFNTRWAMHTLENMYSEVTELNFIGGGATSDLWCQIMADITNRKINQVEDAQQAGAKGIALLASRTLGYIGSYEEIKDYIKIKNSFLPNSQHRELYDTIFREFKNIYKQNKEWYRRMNHNSLNN